MTREPGDAGRIMMQGDDGAPHYGPDPVVPAHSDPHLPKEKTSHP